MLKHQDFETDFKKLNLTTEEGIALLNYFEALAIIGVEYLKNNDYKNDFYND
jgi:hypothetical protein